MLEEKCASTFRLIQARWTLPYTAIKTIHFSTILKWIHSWLNTKSFLLSAFTSWATLTFSTSGALYWIKKLFLIKTNPVRKGCFLSKERFPIVPGIESVILTQWCSQQLISKCKFLLGFWTFLTWDGPKFWKWWTHWLWSSCLDSFVSLLELFRLHAILHQAAAGVRTHSGKGPDYCYMIARGPNSCLLDRVTGLLFCLHVKLFLPWIFNSVAFGSCILIVLYIKLTEENIIKELGLFIDGSSQGILFFPAETFKPNKQTTWNTYQLHGIAWSSGKLDCEKLFAVSYDIKVMDSEVFAKGLEKSRLLTRLIGQNSEILNDHGFPKIKDLFKMDSSWIYSSYPFRHKTRLQCAEVKAKVYGEWAMQHL